MGRREKVFKSFDQYRDETDDRIQHGIEQYRKGFATVVIKDMQGKPTTGVTINIKQKKHEFLHGANLFMLDELETEEKNIRYQEAFKQVFNQATLPFYWNTLEPEQGKPRFSKDSSKVYRRPPIDLCMDYCEKNGITPKAHCLTYFPFQPDWVDKYDIDDIKKKLEVRYQQCAQRYADVIPGWEVLNELFCTRDPSWRDNIFFQADDVVDWNFKLAEQYFPKNELIINEAPFVWDGLFAFGRSGYYLMIQQALERGVRIDTVGLQYHIFNTQKEEEMLFQNMYHPKQLYEVMDQYAKLGLPLQVTEITIPAYEDGKEGEAIQAELVERLYSIWFSHPAMEAIIYWNLADGYAHGAHPGDMTVGENIYFGGLLRFDMSKKPAYDMIKHLFTERWITRTTIRTNGTGIAKFKGFYGDYELQIDGKVYPITLSSKKNNMFEFIL